MLFFVMAASFKMCLSGYSSILVKGPMCALINVTDGAIRQNFIDSRLPIARVTLRCGCL